MKRCETSLKQGYISIYIVTCIKLISLCLNRIGKVGDVYRPIDSMTFPKEFALVGFYKNEHVSAAIAILTKDKFIDNIEVTAEEAKQWLLDLYPKP